MDLKKFALESLDESSETKLNMKNACLDDIIRAVELVADTYRAGKKMLLCGNGGSAADCQHIATEFMIRLSHDIQRPALPAIALTTDSSNLTAGGNDIGFDNVFARNVEGLGSEGDVLLAISTSGNSPNVIKAAEMARMKGMNVIGFLGGTGGKLKPLVDVAVVIPSSNVQRIQEGHITAAHILCEGVEGSLYR
ncbi:MAG: SIS domain-containing protein [Ignavibacteriales bacterium]|jgi:D-sedoheptulose 7-phosphate isomerase|nr:SIS domain-containing protein [Ignavibacteriaceae bacterium]NLH60276.1 SIS domain-containing protein [Ignavibacteriales bacterium]HOJ19182.1 SIS domain-containing protein [Ignavibacteriaceae bacterium]HPO54704.1 SIS domain-containing protein [Ignavibacteriaceae bacterium]